MIRSFQKCETGNALWFILLAVALLGFLTAFLSRGTSSTNQTGDIESARIKASALLQYTKSIETAVQNMLLSGISESDLDFSAINAAHNNPNCTEDRCEVFNTNGGGIPYRSAAKVIGNSNLIINWHISTANRNYLFGCDTGNNSCTELLLLLTNIPKSICLQVNRIQKITNPNNDAPQQTEMAEGSAYNGTFASSGLNTVYIGGTTAAEAPEVRGKQAGCVYEFGGGQNKYHFYHILIAR